MRRHRSSTAAAGLRSEIIGMRSTSSRYGAGAQAFHWLTVMLVLAAYVLSKGDRDSLYSAAADGLRRIHETLGVLVFIVVVLRLLWRLIDSTPAKQPMPRWMAAAAKLVQFALYALLIAIPATAVLGTWLEGIPVTLPGFDIAPDCEGAWTGAADHGTTHHPRQRHPLDCRRACRRGSLPPLLSARRSLSVDGSGRMND
jgi:cytochrome b561